MWLKGGACDCVFATEFHKMMKRSILLLFINSVYEHYFCEANDICENRFHIISSLSQSDCPADVTIGNIVYKHYLMQNESQDQCFPYCKKIKTDLTQKYFCSEKEPCPPAYTCQKSTDGNYNCVLDETSCMKYHVNYNAKDKAFFGAMWKPTCLPDGSWAPKQCKGEKFTGRCFCFDAVGNRIDGQQWSVKADNMTCACSRKRAEMMLDKSNNYITMHCDDEGNYEPLQCSDDQCWCADPKTGIVISQIVVENMMKVLPCYDLIKNGHQYMRQCESQQYAQKKIISQLKTRGTTGFEYDTKLCDADGTFGIYKITGASATCIWKDDTLLDNFQMGLGENIKTLNCRCARDLKYYNMAGYDPETRGQCAPNGNYEPVQFRILEDIGQQYFCVDDDGYQKSPIVNKRPTSCVKFK